MPQVLSTAQRMQVAGTCTNEVHVLEHSAPAGHAAEHDIRRGQLSRPPRLLLSMSAPAAVHAGFSLSESHLESQSAVISQQQPGSSTTTGELLARLLVMPFKRPLWFTSAHHLTCSLMQAAASIGRTSAHHLVWASVCVPTNLSTPSSLMQAAAEVGWCSDSRRRAFILQLSV